MMLASQGSITPISTNWLEDGTLGDNGSAPETENDREHFILSIGQLPDKYQIVMHMHYVKGLSCPEIARLLTIPLETVKSRVTRANQQIRRLLTNDGILIQAYKTDVGLEGLRWNSVELAIQIKKLPSSFRRIMELHYLEHLSYSEIALLYKMRINTVKSRVHRGKIMLLER